MHTIKVIAGGFLLLAVCLLVGRAVGGQAPAASVAGAAKLFIPLWLISAAVNLWIGVSKAGYSALKGRLQSTRMHRSAYLRCSLNGRRQPISRSSCS